MKKHTITDELLRELHSEADLPLRDKIEKEVPGFQPAQKTPQDVADAFIADLDQYMSDFKTTFLNKLKDE